MRPDGLWKSRPKTIDRKLEVAFFQVARGQLSGVIVTVERRPSRQGNGDISVYYTTSTEKYKKN